MNKKIKITFMILIVAAVWGKIIYELVTHQKTDLPVGISPVAIQPDETATPLEEKQELSLQYPDPFLKFSIRASEARPVSSPSSRNKPIQKPIETNNLPPLKWPSLEYLGMMKSKDRNASLAILKVGQEEYVVGANEYVQDCKVVSVQKDSVVVTMGGQLKTIKR